MLSLPFKAASDVLHDTVPGWIAQRDLPPEITEALEG